MWHVSASLTLSLTMKCVSDLTSLCTVCQLWTAGVCINMSPSSPCLTLNTSCRITSPLVIPPAFLSTWRSGTNKRIQKTFTKLHLYASTCTYTWYLPRLCMIFTFMSLALACVVRKSTTSLHLAATCHSLCLSVCQVLCCIPLYSEICSGTDTNVRILWQVPPTSTTNLTHIQK